MPRLDRIDLLCLRLVEYLERRPTCSENDDAAVFAAPVGQLLEPNRISIERHGRVEIGDRERHSQLGDLSHLMVKRLAARVASRSHRLEAACVGRMATGVEFAIEYGGDPQDVTLTLSGVADVAEIARCNRALASDGRFRAGLAILCDCTALQTTVPSQEVTDAVVESINVRDLEHPPRAVAYVVADEKAAEPFSIFRAHLGGSKSQRRVFISRQDALDWLRTTKPY
jgi:hypothetical protein